MTLHSYNEIALRKSTWQHPTNNVTHLHMIIIAWLSKEIQMLELFLFETIV
jgi:hypothetical protein